MHPKDAVKRYLDEALPAPTDLEVPPSPELGDLAVPCYQLAKHLKKAPKQIAKDLAQQLEPEPPIARFEATGPYLNVFYSREAIATHVLTASLEPEGKDETLLFEYPSPNTNKPLHLGHLRNMLLGSAAANTCEAAGYDVIRTNLYNDRGVHICKSMLAYERFGDGKTPADMDMKPDHFVGHWYVEYAKRAQQDPSLEQDVQEMLKAWEDGDEDVRELWKQMNAWAYSGYEETFSRVGIAHDKTYYESETYRHGKRIVEDGLKQGLFEKDENGNVIVDLEADGLGTKVLLRADGTSVYMTQDLYLAQTRQEEHDPDAQVYVVGEEQKHHFNQLFTTLEKLGYPHADRLYHLAYGLIALPDGRMKSREGTVVDTDELLDELEALAASAVEKRHPDIGGEELAARAKAIGHAALKFYILKYEPKTGFTYDPEESLSFEGETGPYCQYAVARINSILREASPDAPDATQLTADEEYALLKALLDTPEAIDEAAEKYKPHLVARHALNIAQRFTAFYHECPVLDAQTSVRDARLALLQATKRHLEHLLGLLGVGCPEQM